MGKPNRRTVFNRKICADRLEKMRQKKEGEASRSEETRKEGETSRRAETKKKAKTSKKIKILVDSETQTEETPEKAGSNKERQNQEDEIANAVHASKNSTSSDRRTLASRECVTGRRLISCKSLENAMISVAAHGRECEKSSSRILREDKIGMATSIFFGCCCGWEIAVGSDSGHEQFPINRTLAYGAINAPIGYDDLTTLVTCLDVPNAPPEKFRNEQTEATDILRDVLVENLRENVAEEVRLAIEANQFVNVGRITMPWVKGLCDGGWVKRSHGHT